MGHTHYIACNKPAKGLALETERKYQKAISECAKVIRYYSETFGGLSGYSAHSSNYLGLKFNGSARVGGCEDFIMREHYSQNESFNFCKTNRLPYDTVVVACLIILKHRLGECIEVSSDGRRDDWNDGLILVRKVLGLVRIDIPSTIRPNEPIDKKASQNGALRYF